MSVNEALRDRAIRHAIELGRYGNGLSDKLVRLLNSADAEMVEKLAGGLANIEGRGAFMTKAERARLEKLLKEIRALNAAIYGQVGDELTDELNDLAIAEAGFQRAALVTSIGADLSIVLPAPARLRAIVEETPMDGHLLANWLDGAERGRIDRVSAAIRQGMLQGETTDQLVRRIRGTKAGGYRDGVLEISRRSAQSMVRTAVSHVSNTAAQHTWKANAHVVKGWQFLATLDSRTTPICGSLDGQTFEIGEGPIPPRHIRCRSISVAVTKSFNELGVEREELPKGKRASMDGQVAGTTRFKDWLRDKGPEVQESVLGKTRADLFRSGKVDLEQFIRNDGNLLTLEELRKRYGSVLS